MSLLVSSGVGRLTIDMISGECERNGRRIEAPYIAGELKAWLARELQKQNDPPEDITAVLDVTFGAVKKQYPTSWAVQWSIDATATITSGGKTYSDTYSTP